MNSGNRFVYFRQVGNELANPIGWPVHSRTRLQAIALNRAGDLEGAARALNAMAKTIDQGPNGEDPRIQDVVISLRRDARRYGRQMSESDRKHHSQVSYTRIRSKREDGTSVRLGET